MRALALTNYVSLLNGNTRGGFSYVLEMRQVRVLITIFCSGPGGYEAPFCQLPALLHRIDHCDRAKILQDHAPADA
jgi:hypothetical protein